MNRHLPLACTLLAASCGVLKADNSKLDMSGWQVWTLTECGVRLKLPKHYSEKHWAVKVGNPIGRSFRGEAFDRIEIDVRSSPQVKLADNKIIRQRDYQVYTESTETLG